MRFSRWKTLEWVAIFFSRGSSRPRDRNCVSCMDSLFATIHLASPNPVYLIILYKNAGWPPTPKNKPHSVTAPSGSLKEKANEMTLKAVHASTQTGNKTFGISIRGTCLGWGLNYTVLHLSTSSPTPTTSTVASQHVFPRGFSRSIWTQSFHWETSIPQESRRQSWPHKASPSPAPGRRPPCERPGWGGDPHGPAALMRRPPAPTGSGDAAKADSTSAARGR